MTHEGVTHVSSRRMAPVGLGGTLMLRKCSRRLVLAGAVVLLTAGAAESQTNSSIAGVVRDPTGAVLPGVTVEVSSPALIEKLRTVTTDSTGQYRIIELVPGVYAVSFALPGFNTVRRSGIELTTNFTATINAELR